MSVVFAPVSRTASATVLKTGIPSTSCPALPGVTPANTCVPYLRLRSAWKRPSLPVRPCTTRRVPLSTMIAISGGPLVLASPGLDDDRLQGERTVLHVIREQLADARGVLGRRVDPREPVLDHGMTFE